MTDGQIHTILVGVDGTERSRDALALGHVLGEAGGARLLMAYVHPYGEVSNLVGPGGHRATRLRRPPARHGTRRLRVRRTTRVTISAQMGRSDHASPR